MLADLAGVPLIKRVFERCKNTGLDTFVVTPNQEIIDAVGQGILVGHADNGTERCMLAIGSVLNYDQYVNVQGDMPDITEDIIFTVADRLVEYDVVTAYTKMPKEKQNDPSSVKLIHNSGRARWFCRAGLEYGSHHIGVYGYSKLAKSIYTNTVKFPEEDIEKLEQLRWIQNNIPLGVVEVEFNGIEINTPNDLEEWRSKNA